MTRYQRTTYVEALQWSGKAAELEVWLQLLADKRPAGVLRAAKNDYDGRARHQLCIQLDTGLTGTTVRPGDWVVSENGHIQILDNATFQHLYTKVETF